MQATLSKRAIGCIGKCTSGLKQEELDQITDNIGKTLVHPRGRQIFKRYLEQRDLRTNLECLELYEACCKSIDDEHSRTQSRKEPSLESLVDDVCMVREMAGDLDGVSLIDRTLLKTFKEALKSECRREMLAVLEETRDRCRDHLRSVHEGFKEYVSEPCPMTK